MSTASTHCAFLELPAELRNRIHEYALVAAEPIIMDSADSFAQPAWLQTCRQTREESSPIYYYQNRFEFVVIHGDSTVLQAWCHQARAFWGTLEEKFIFDFGDTSLKLSWSKCRDWLEAYYHGRVIRAGRGCNHHEQTGCNDLCALVAAFDMVTELRDVLDWANMEKLLELHRKVTQAQADGRWKWDE